MIYNFNLPALDLSGAPQKDGSGQEIILGKVLANMLASQPKGNALKFYDWAKKMFAGDPINIDRSDCKVLREFIDNSEQLTILAKAQLIEILETGKDES